MGLCERGDDPNNGSKLLQNKNGSKIDFRMSKNALWDACVAQWLIVSNESLRESGGMI